MNLLLSKLRKWRHTFFSTPHIFLIFTMTTISLFSLKHSEAAPSNILTQELSAKLFLNLGQLRTENSLNNAGTVVVAFGGLRANDVTKVNAFFGDNFVLDTDIFSKIILNVNHEWHSEDSRRHDSEDAGDRRRDSGQGYFTGISEL